MNADSYQDKLEIIATLKRRLHQRKIQAAKYGSSVDPSITIEIEELQEKVQRLEQELDMSVAA